ncbi:MULTISPECIES: hypothetical protein [unclassified Methylobacterium]|uniref:hypothetical protein n=1 Tax=unclassified Methylobacterium TaxID=2615210 RepID=UPI002269B7ED|nr:MULTISPECIES: hypothetical protein [unclassified Methylobacterium]
MAFTVKHILIALVCALVAAISAQGVLGVSQLRSVHDNALDLSTNWLPSVSKLGEIKYKITRLRLVDARLVTAVEPVNDLVEISDHRLGEAEAVAAGYVSLISSTEEGGPLDRVQATLERIPGVSRETDRGGASQGSACPQRIVPGLAHTLREGPGLSRP